MTEFRVILLLIGVLLFVAVYVISRRRARRDERAPMMRDSLDEDPSLPEMRSGPKGDAGVQDEELPEFRIPVDDGEAEAPSGEPVRTTTDSGESARRKTGADSPPDPDRQKIVVLHVTPRESERFAGAEVLEALRDEGLAYGRYSIFHRESDDGNVFSVAHMVEPGTLDPEALPEERLRGLTFFLLLPGPRAGVDAFADMLATARRIAGRLEGEVKDASRGTLTRQTAHHLREEIIAFQHHLDVHAVTGKGHGRI